MPATSLFGLSPMATGVMPQMGAGMGMGMPFGMPQMGMAAPQYQLNPFSSNATSMVAPTPTEKSALHMMLLQQQFAGAAQGMEVTLMPTEQFYIAEAIREKQEKERLVEEKRYKETRTGAHYTIPPPFEEPDGE